MPGDIVPPTMMTPARREWARGLGLAQALQPEPGVAEPIAEPVPSPLPPVAAAVVQSERQLALVGRTVTGRQHLVLQVPGGQVRFEGTLSEAKAEARALAGSESAAFVIVEPVCVVQPQTTITEEPVACA